MKRLVYLIPILLLSLLPLPNALPVQAAPPQAAPVLYLPIIQKERLDLNAAVSAIEPAATGSATTFHTPLDATPDPDGNQIYFTAMSSRGAGVFRVPAAGGTVVTLTVGLPVTTPVGIAVSTDGNTLYLADTYAANQQHSRRDHGRRPLQLAQQWRRSYPHPRHRPHCAPRPHRGQGKQCRCHLLYRR
jgi:DNA-binding beta-propeller fold protein YncE